MFRIFEEISGSKRPRKEFVDQLLAANFVSDRSWQTRIPVAGNIRMTGRYKDFMALLSAEYGLSFINLYTGKTCWHIPRIDVGDWYIPVEILVDNTGLVVLIFECNTFEHFRNALIFKNGVKTGEIFGGFSDRGNILESELSLHVCNGRIFDVHSKSAKFREFDQTGSLVTSISVHIPKVRNDEYADTFCDKKYFIYAAPKACEVELFVFDLAKKTHRVLRCDVTPFCWTITGLTCHQDYVVFHTCNNTEETRAALIIYDLVHEKEVRRFHLREDDYEVKDITSDKRFTVILLKKHGFAGDPRVVAIDWRTLNLCELDLPAGYTPLRLKNACTIIDNTLILCCNKSQEVATCLVFKLGVDSRLLHAKDFMVNSRLALNNCKPYSLKDERLVIPFVGDNSSGLLIEDFGISPDYARRANPGYI